MQQSAYRKDPVPATPPSQQNPGANRLAMTDERKRAAMAVLAEYYRAVEQGRAPAD